jgi:hypothetical protein
MSVAELLNACDKRKIEVVKRILEENPQLALRQSGECKCPLEIAMVRGNMPMVRLICTYCPVAVRELVSLMNFMMIAAQFRMPDAILLFHSISPDLLDLTHFTGYTAMFYGRSSKIVIKTLHQLGSEAHFQSTKTEGSPVEHKKIGPFTRRLYYSRSLTEVLFFVQTQ